MATTVQNANFVSNYVQRDGNEYLHFVENLAIFFLSSALIVAVYICIFKFRIGKKQIETFARQYLIELDRLDIGRLLYIFLATFIGGFLFILGLSSLIVSIMQMLRIL